MRKVRSSADGLGRVVALVGHDLLDSHAGLLHVLDRLHHTVHECLRVRVIGRVDLGCQDHTALLVDHVLGLVGQVRVSLSLRPSSRITRVTNLLPVLAAVARHDIGILIGLLLSAAKDTREAARHSQWINQLRQLRIAASFSSKAWMRFHSSALPHCWIMDSNAGEALMRRRLGCLARHVRQAAACSPQEGKPFHV